MLTRNEYKVLKVIQEITTQKSLESYKTSDFIFRDKILKELNLEEYEFNEIMRSLNSKEYICNIFNADDKYIHGTSIVDAGRVALKHYKKNCFVYIFKQYIWTIFIIVLTAVLTAYFTYLFTK